LGTALSGCCERRPGAVARFNDLRDRDWPRSQSRAPNASPDTCVRPRSSVALGFRLQSPVFAGRCDEAVSRNRMATPTRLHKQCVSCKL
jgi:hypothetical protein